MKGKSSHDLLDDSTLSCVPAVDDVDDADHTAKVMVSVYCCCHDH